ncbi:MAG: bifunctional UDP-sugar hydrolase/5'-nucleotidase [Bacteroidetes bacterium]|nr:bifunctional UDP-sugar hydrolase/5'-nucleotidase [Bacteroidota bacterium]
MNKRYFPLVPTFFFLLPLLLFSQDPAQKKPTEVIILHVNDMHSKIDNMAKLAYLADSLRRFHPFVFLVAAGDNFTGNPVVDMIPDKGFPMVDMMNRCGFNLSAMGNHEFDMGQEMFNKRMAQAKFPFICCNLNAFGATLKQPRPFQVFGAGNGDSIAFLGLIQLDDNGLPSAHPSNMKGITFTNGLVKAREYSWLKDRYGIMIGLSHLGVDDDIRLADSMPQFDVIIGGHSHTLLEKPLMEKNVMIVQAEANLRYVGKLTLMIQKGHLISRSDEVIPFTILKNEKPEVRNYIDEVNNNKEFNKVIGFAEKPLEGVDELGSLMTDALTAQLKVDIAFQNKGGIRVQSMNAGNITLKDIYKLDPFNNQVILFSMTADEIKSLICYGYRHEKGIDLQVSGMSYEVTDDGATKCISVKMLDKSGKLLDSSKEYLVAMNNYMAYTYKFDHRDQGTLSNLTTAEAVIKYLGVAGKINYSGIKRATVNQ